MEGLMSEFDNVTEDDLEEIVYQGALIMYQRNMRGRFQHRHKGRRCVQHPIRRPSFDMPMPDRRDPSTSAEFLHRLQSEI